MVKNDKDKIKIYILYGSETGNTKKYANDLYNFIENF